MNATLTHSGIRHGITRAEVKCTIIERGHEVEAIYCGTLIEDEGTLYISRGGEGYGYTVHPGAKRERLSGFIPREAEALLWHGIDAAQVM